jgi:hypothetical protein
LPKQDNTRAKKNEAARQARIAYEQKLQEPEYTPYRSEHRRKARECLESKGVTALPLYMLIDFTPEIDSQSSLAGGIEYLLEDAGLLDALVVLDTDAATADAILVEEGLSDCRLDVQHLTNDHGQQDQQDSTVPSLSKRLLQIDPAIHDILHGTP